jgi:ribonucleoside-triphosphate reductase
MAKQKSARKKDKIKSKKSKNSPAKLTKIVKRSGRVVPFKEEKITKAVLKALRETEEGDKKEADKVSKKVAQFLNKNYKKGYVPEIEEIQDAVEKVLIILDFDKTAKAYILYRDQHRKVRETEEALKEAVDLVDDYISEADWKVKENSNMGFSLQGLNNFISGSDS